MTDHEKTILLQYLKGVQPFEFQGTRRYSTLVAGLRDCRNNTKRDLNTGIFNQNLNGDPGNWLGAIGYFTVLDQIGSCFKLQNRPRSINTTNSIKLAIENFGYDIINQDEHKLNALIALRNAFTHDFNLLNIPTNNNSLQVHKFTVTAEINDNWVVKLPLIPWDKNIEGKDFNNINDATYINLFGLGQLVETIYSRICDLINDDQIELNMKMTTLINKYTFVTSSNPISD